MTKASKEFDEFIYANIESKREELRKGIKNDQMGDLLTIFMKKEKESQVVVHDDKFLRDAAFNLFVAGRDTITSALTWLFYLVATHPLVETKILEEIKENFGSINNIEKKLGIDDLKKLVYLQGAICEALRLFPPIPFETKQAIKGDILPSGHIVNPNTIILFSLYSMGRIEETWGKDCLEFKPERWISERGGIVHNPSYKFFSFNAGPRTCLGKDLSFIQIKMIAISILCKYRVLLVEGRVPLLSHSIILLMKNGFKVRITKREI
jgi:cytochrome P450